MINSILAVSTGLIVGIVAVVVVILALFFSFVPVSLWFLTVV